MTHEDESHFIACIGEECGEIQQEVGKSLRFGFHNPHLVTGEIHRDAIIREFNDLCGAMITLYDCKIEDLINHNHIDAKSAKILKFLVEQKQQKMVDKSSQV